MVTTWWGVVGVLGLVVITLTSGITAVILKLKLDDAKRRLHKIIRDLEDARD
jgi:hypothetical protein